MMLIDVPAVADAVPSGGMFAAVAAVIFFLLVAAAAYVAFRALKKTVKMAVRMTIVAVILLVAVIGSLSLWYFSSEGTQKQKPPVNKKR